MSIPEQPRVSPDAEPTEEVNLQEFLPTEKSLFDHPILRFGINVMTLIVVGLLIFLVGKRFQPAPAGPVRGNAVVQAAALPETTKGEVAVALAPVMNNLVVSDGIFRRLEFKTIIPSRSRVDVITYTVSKGDTLFSIADEFGLQPETLLWSNYDTLNDNPHLLSPDQVLNVLPVDGVYYEWQEGDRLGNVATFFGVEEQVILDFPGNNFDLTAVNTDSAGLQPGQWLIIPGGKRATQDWGPPTISRSNPAAARYYGEGSCGTVVDGAVGSGTFVWPTTDHNISGYQYSGIHPAIDIGGSLGNPVFAADSGVIVYAGWSSHGYGNLVVIDHGNGFQTAYAHLDTVGVGCGQSVFQGGYIGGLGSTGNSSGPHLHFEVVYNGAKPNPLDFVQ